MLEEHPERSVDDEEGYLVWREGNTMDLRQNIEL